MHFSEILQREIGNVVHIHMRNTYQGSSRCVCSCWFYLVQMDLFSWKEKNKRIFQSYPCLVPCTNPYGTTLRCFRLGSVFWFLYFFFSNLSKCFLLKNWHKNVSGGNQNSCSFSSKLFFISKVIYRLWLKNFLGIDIQELLKWVFKLLILMKYDIKKC